MLKEIKQKTEARDLKIAEMEAIITASTDETRSLTEDENSKWESLKVEVETLNNDVETLRKQENISAMKSVSTNAPKVEDKQENRNYNIGKAILEHAEGRLSGYEKEMHEEGKRNFNNLGVATSGLIIPSSVFTRANVTTTTGAAAILTAQSSQVSLLSAPSIIEKLGARFLTNLDSVIELPKVSAATATFPGETVAAVDGGAVISKVSLSPRRVGVAQPFTKEYLAQSNPAVTRSIISDLSDAIMRAVNIDAFAALAAATTNVVTATSDVWTDLVDMEAAVEVDNALEGKLNYSMPHAEKAVLKTTYKDAGSGQAVWAADNSINGYGAYSSNHNTADTVYFGNWNDLIVGQWGGLEIITDPYTLAREGMIDVIANAFFDTAVLNGVSFTSMDISAAT